MEKAVRLHTLQRWFRRLWKLLLFLGQKCYGKVLCGTQRWRKNCMEQLDVIREMIQKKIPYKKVRTVWFLSVDVQNSIL